MRLCLVKIYAIISLRSSFDDANTAISLIIMLPTKTTENNNQEKAIKYIKKPSEQVKPPVKTPHQSKVASEWLKITQVNRQNENPFLIMPNPSSETVKSVIKNREQKPSPPKKKKKQTVEPVLP